MSHVPSRRTRDPTEQRDVRACSRGSDSTRFGRHGRERAALLAEGADFDVTMAWIVAHGGEPEAAVVATASRGGLHGCPPGLTRPAGPAGAAALCLPPGA